MPEPLRILVVEDSSDDTELILREFQKSGYHPYMERVDTPESFLNRLRTSDWDIIIADFNLPKFNANDALQMMIKENKDIPFIIVSGSIGEDVAVSILKAGAHDYIMKNNMARLVTAVERELHEVRERREKKRAEELSRSFASLGQKLSEVTTSQQAANVIFDIADELLGWDATSLDLYSSENNTIQAILNFDTMDGKRVLVPPAYTDKNPSIIAQRVIREGAQLILRKNPDEDLEMTPFGDTTKRSASLMFVPIRLREKVIGVLSVQSYQFNAYTEKDLEILQVLADHCSGALNRIQSETALREISEIQKLQVHVSPLAIILMDTTGKVKSWNPSAETIFGWKQEDVLGKDLPIVPGEQLDDFREYLHKELSGEKYLGVELRRLRKDKTIIDVNMWSAPIYDFNGSVIGIMNIYSDISERKNLENQLQHAQKMEVVGTLAGGISHDFNNLLTTIIGNAELVLTQTDLGASIKESLEDIHLAGQRAAELTRQLLLFSRKTQPQFQSCDLHSIIHDSLRILKRTLGPSIMIQIQSEAQYTRLFGDPIQIQQIIMNLSINARDAMPDGGTLTIKTENINIDKEYCQFVSYAHPGDFVVMSIIDTGIGMDEETQKHIFEPFYTTKDIGKGTGLGLAVVYGVVKNHNGWIHIYSELSHGATFKVYLPFEQDLMEIFQLDKEIQPHPTGTETILLVDDDPLVLKLGRDILEKYGYTMICTERASEGLEIYKKLKDKIHLIISDLLMPEMDGRVFIRELKKINPMAKIILCSGADTHQTGPVEGVHHIITKPFRMNTLTQLVRKVLDHT